MPSTDFSIQVTRANNTIFIPLPPEMRKPIDGARCCCCWCMAHPEFESQWDTMALHAVPTDEDDRTWLVHCPDLTTSHVARVIPADDSTLDIAERPPPNC